MPIKPPRALIEPPEIVFYGCRPWEPSRDLTGMATQDRATGLWTPGAARVRGKSRQAVRCSTCADGAAIRAGTFDYCEACGRAGAVKPDPPKLLADEPSPSTQSTNKETPQ